jgi:prophage antirepressor-like protein
MSDLTVFEFGSHKVRTAGTAEAPLFCAADVCAVLDIANSRDAISRLREAERTTVGNTDTGKNAAKRGTPPRQPRVYVNEAGLYKLIFSSRKQEAERFQDFVTGEVLPSIRRTGAYSLVEQQERQKIKELCFLGLPEHAEPMFNELIDALRPLAAASDGTPPWARLIAKWVYEWALGDLKPELRKINKKNIEGKLDWRDYEALTPQGREMVSRVIAKAAFAAEEAHNWEDWRGRMESHYRKKPRQLWLRPVPKLPKRGRK